MPRASTKAQTIIFVRDVMVRAKRGKRRYLAFVFVGTQLSGTIRAYVKNGVEKFRITEASGRVLSSVPYHAVRFVED